MRRSLALTAVLALALALTPGGVATAVTAGQALTFHEIPPCPLFDTRPSQGGTGIMAAGETRTFHVVGGISNFGGQGGIAGGCGIPGFSAGQPQTQMVFLNLVAIDPVTGGNLKVWATTDPEPGGGVVNYQKLTPNLNNSNAIVVGVRQDSEGNDIAVKANVGSVHVRGVALGYLTTASRSFWALGGNAGTDPATQFLGTTDNKALNFRVNGQRALRLEPNATSANVIGGFSGNSVTAVVVGATIGGGGDSGLTNRVTDDYGTVGGGRNNRAGNDAGTLTDASESTVGGGINNTASGHRATVGGGSGNTASAIGSPTVGGGSNNTASGHTATVGGGSNNTASGNGATVSGSYQNTASGIAAAVGGGELNMAGGSWATIPGGRNNYTQADYGFAAGRRARAIHPGAFVWGDSTDADVTSKGDNSFTARVSGGAWFFSNSTLTTGVTLAPNGGSWASVSDRSVKADIRTVAPGEILARVVELPITTWRYQGQDSSIRHIGPMAQDFHAAFGVGEDERHITAVDADGVALAAIQGLDQRDGAMLSHMEEQQERIADLEERLSSAGGTPAGPPQAALWAVAAAIGLLGLGLGRRWGRAGALAG